MHLDDFCMVNCKQIYHTLSVWDIVMLALQNLSFIFDPAYEMSKIFKVDRGSNENEY